MSAKQNPTSTKKLTIAIRKARESRDHHVSRARRQLGPTQGAALAGRPFTFDDDETAAHQTDAQPASAYA